MSKFDDEVDAVVRAQAFALLRNLTEQHGDVLPFAPLSQGFEFNGQRVPLLGPKGIFKPQVLQVPLSITTAPNGPYDDAYDTEGFLRYRYRGTDPDHPDNVGLRRVMQTGKPLLYLHGLIKGRYQASWPVYVIRDDPGNLSFTVALDDSRNISYSSEGQTQDGEIAIRRRYLTVASRIRLHQRLFRERVLNAYYDSCALCRLAHRELLEAAHIIPDAEEAGEPKVSNGLSFCKLHHAAFDQGILGIRPDCTAEIRIDILEEVDGPMLKHGIQAMHGVKLRTPRSPLLKPNKEALEYRYEKFRSA
ncbi:MAG: HNH endonuclease [Proteobacteria bacterium]|nr:HNH endonuclease [Pseudomonadota bacterium]